MVGNACDEGVHAGILVLMDLHKTNIHADQEVFNGAVSASKGTSELSYAVAGLLSTTAQNT